MLYRDTYATVNIKHLLHNVDYVYSHVQKPMMAIIKANAYGHGYKEVASILKDKDEIITFGVATLKEAVDLRKAGVKKDILVLGAIPLDDLDIVVENDISLTLFSFDYLKEIIALHHHNKPIKVHIALDTGMNRIGFKTKQDFDQVLSLCPNGIIEVDGVFTHFATADMKDKEDEYNLQLKKFEEILDGRTFKYIHCQNSASMAYHKPTNTNMTRIGISMYGVDPAGEESEDLQQVMSLYTRVALVKEVKKGEHIGYGYTYTASSDCLIATLPIGYADGFIRENQDRNVYINGKEYPVVGRVCMDQVMIKVDEDVKVHDLVEIFGEHISLSRMAKELHTIPYEITCLLSERVEKEYIY